LISNVAATPSLALSALTDDPAEPLPNANELPTPTDNDPATEYGTPTVTDVATPTTNDADEATVTKPDTGPFGSIFDPPVKLNAAPEPSSSIPADP
jgi:hypothetical protein